MQYAALVWHSKKIIYISAISRDHPVAYIIDLTTMTFGTTPSETWKTFAEIVCDGGTSWGVIYDVDTGKFSDLAVNGVA